MRTTHGSASDADLLAAARSGDKAALETLLVLTGDRLQAFRLRARRRSERREPRVRFTTARG